MNEIIVKNSLVEQEEQNKKNDATRKDSRAK